MLCKLNMLFAYLERKLKGSSIFGLSLKQALNLAVCWPDETEFQAVPHASAWKKSYYLTPSGQHLKDFNTSLTLSPTGPGLLLWDVVWNSN